MLVKVAMPKNMSALAGGGHKEELQRLLSLLDGAQTPDDSPGLSRSSVTSNGGGARKKRNKKGTSGQPMLFCSARISLTLVIMGQRKRRMMASMEEIPSRASSVKVLPTCEVQRRNKIN